MSDDPLKHTAEIAIVSPRCGYRTVRTAARLRRKTEIPCPSVGGPVAPGADECDHPPSRAGWQVRAVAESLHLRMIGLRWTRSPVP